MVRSMADQTHAPAAPVDFSTHVLSLASTALGSRLRQDAGAGRRAPPGRSVETARHLIDVLRDARGQDQGQPSRRARRSCSRAWSTICASRTSIAQPKQARDASSCSGSLAVALVAGCRERDVGIDARAASGCRRDGGALDHAHSCIRRRPGSFVDLIAGARHGLVAIRAASPVKSGPAAMFPGAPETTADVALGTGFLIEANGVFIVTTDQIASASTELHVVLPDRTEVPAKLVGRDDAARSGFSSQSMSVDGRRPVPSRQRLPKGGAVR